MKDKEENEIVAAGQEPPAKGFSLKNRRPAYKVAIIIVVVLAVIYLVSVYKNRHEAKAAPSPTTVESPYKKDEGDGK